MDSTRRRSHALRDAFKRIVVLISGDNVLTGQGNVLQINYLVRARNERLKLIEGDPESFSDVLSLIDDYEGKP